MKRGGKKLNRINAAGHITSSVTLHSNFAIPKLSPCPLFIYILPRHAKNAAPSGEWLFRGGLIFDSSGDKKDADAGSKRVGGF